MRKFGFYYTSEKESEKREQKKAWHSLEIVTVRVVRLSGPGIWHHNTLNTLALRAAPIPHARSAHL